MSNLKFAFLQLLKNPGLTADAVLTLAVAPVISGSVSPGKSNLFFGPHAPYGQTGRHYPNYRAHSICVRVEPPVAKQTSDKVCHLILPNSQCHQAVPGMTEP